MTDRRFIIGLFVIGLTMPSMAQNALNAQDDRLCSEFRDGECKSQWLAEFGYHLRLDGSGLRAADTHYVVVQAGRAVYVRGRVRFDLVVARSAIDLAGEGRFGVGYRVFGLRLPLQPHFGMYLDLFDTRGDGVGAALELGVQVISGVAVSGLLEIPSDHNVGSTTWFLGTQISRQSARPFLGVPVSVTLLGLLFVLIGDSG